MMRLRSVDFPALGFPTTVTIPALGMTGDEDLEDRKMEDTDAWGRSLTY